MSYFRTGLAGACLLFAVSCANGQNNYLAPRELAPNLLGIEFEARGPVAGGQTRQVDINQYLCAELGDESGACGCDGDETGGKGRDAYAARYMCLVAQLDDEPAQVKKKIRNSLSTQLIHASSVNCRSYLWGLRGTQMGGRIAADVFTGAFSLAATVNQHLPTSQLLSGLGAFSSATGASVDRSAFADTGVEIISEEILKMRRRSRSHLEAQMTRSYEAYPLGLALADVSDYHQDCSVMRGLSQMQTELAQREAQVAVSRLTALRIAQAGGDGPAVAAAVGGVADAYSTFSGRGQDEVAPSDARLVFGRTPVLDAAGLDILTKVDVTEETGRAALTAVFKAACAERGFYGEPYCLAAVYLEALNEEPNLAQLEARLTDLSKSVVATRLSAVKLSADIGEAGGSAAEVCEVIAWHKDFSVVDGQTADPVLQAMAKAACPPDTPETPDTAETPKAPEYSGVLAASIAAAAGRAVIDHEDK